MNCLRCVTCGCTLVTHGASQRCRKSGTTESRAHVAATVRTSAGCSRQDGPRLFYLPPPSISISSTGRAIETGCPRHRYQNCVHSEAFRKARRTPAFICQHERVVAERDCDAGVGGVPSAEGEAWVNDHQVGATRFNWNIGLIGCYRQSWNRSTNCWYRINDGRFQRRRIRRR